MAVARQKVTNKARLLQALITKWGQRSIEGLRDRLTAQTGVADGGADLTITNTLAGDVIHDVDNDDYYLVTVAATTTIAFNG